MRTPRPISLAASLAAAALLAAGCASSSPTAKTPTGPNARTVDISMADNTYQPTSPIPIAKGETVKFVFHNTGKLPHEAVLGDMAAQDTHEREMAKPGGMGGMEHGSGHGAGATSSVDVPAGKAASFTKTFNMTGELTIGCHYPGHYSSMHLPVIVS